MKGDLFGSFRINKTMQLRGGIDNALDTDPKIVGRTPGTTDAEGVTNTQYYDVLGRHWPRPPARIPVAWRSS